jgi:hypothetical protein
MGLITDYEPLIAAVKHHAEVNYEAGWSEVVEALTDQQILDIIFRTRTIPGALKKMRAWLAPRISVWEEHGGTIRAEVQVYEGDWVAHTPTEREEIKRKEDAFRASVQDVFYAYTVRRAPCPECFTERTANGACGCSDAVQGVTPIRK